MANDAISLAIQTITYRRKFKAILVNTIHRHNRPYP